MEGQIERLLADIVARKTVEVNVTAETLATIEMYKKQLAVPILRKETAKEYIVNGNCISCGICAKVCPANNINVTKENGVQFAGCKSCFACKVRDGKSLGHCAINDGKLKVGVIYTMNAPEGYMDYLYKNYERLFGMFFNYVGHVAATETLQTNNYDRYYLGKKSEQYKLERREKQFPIDLKNAFDLG